MIKLTRSQIGYPIKGATNIDISVKSCESLWKPVAPTWQMVLAYRSGEITKSEYTIKYRAILEMAEKSGELGGLVGVLGHYESFHNSSHVNFQCYCKDKQFCHTHLLIDYLLEMYPEEFQDGRVTP